MGENASRCIRTISDPYLRTLDPPIRRSGDPYHCEVDPGELTPDGQIWMSISDGSVYTELNQIQMADQGGR